MQVPAPFEYERATSVDHAIGLLERLGEEARLVAGGHSLLPMMKLRLANLEYLIDINDLHDELGYVRVGTDEVRIGAMTRHRELLESPELAALFPIFADAEQVIADPVVRNRGTHRRLAVPGRPVRGPDRGVHRARRQLRDPRRRAASGWCRWRTSTAAPTRPPSGRPRSSPRSGIPVRPHGSSAYAKVERRAGDWAVTSAGAAVWMDGGVITDARVGLAAVGPNTTGIPAISEALRGQDPSEELYAQAGAIAAESCSPVDRQPRDGRLQAAPRRRAHPAHAAHAPSSGSGRPCRRPGKGRADMQVTMTVNGESVTREIEGRMLLVHFLRDELGLTGTHWGCDTSNCGTCVTWLDGEPVKTCTVLAAMAGGREVRTVEGLEKDGVLDPVRRASCAATGCSAASARRAC